MNYNTCSTNEKERISLTMHEEKNNVEIIREKEEKPKRSVGKICIAFVCLILISAIVGALAGGGMYFALKAYDDVNTESPEKPSVVLPTVSDDDAGSDLNINDSNSDDKDKVSTSITRVVEAVMPSMVSINVTATTIVEGPFGGVFGGSQEYEVSGSGSGVIAMKSEEFLFIITNHHVIDGAKSISVTFVDGKSYSADIKGSDSDFDLAVLSIRLSSIDSDTLSKINIAVFGSSDNLVLGEPAIAIGNALGYGQSVTVGYISALEREVRMEDKTMSLIQTDAAINPGNSGGALLNIKGEVVGINSSKYASTEVEGMGFAIPMSSASVIVDEIINETVIPEDEKAYLGITGGTVQSSWVSAYDWPEGVYVNAVTKGSPADEYGIKAQDIITGFDGKEIKSIDSLSSKLSRKRGGELVEITVMRQNDYGEFEEIKLNVTLGYNKNAQ